MGYLILETGDVFSGKFIGSRERAGEVVFNTSHHGYQEIASDPSYFSQIVVMTAPHQGNYGEHSSNMESNRIWIEGLVCLQMQNSIRDQQWKEKLESQSIPILENVDTRKLTLFLRDRGSVYGALVREKNLPEASKKAQELIQQSLQKEKDWPYLVSTTQPYDVKGCLSNGPRIAVLDFGCKKNILNKLSQKCSLIRVFPSRTSVEEIIQFSPQGILLSNGPGDPSYVKSVETIQKLLGKYFIFGICMGCQILALALGGKTRKLKFGHRGSNHPVKDLIQKNIYMTSQNHGYVVDEGSLPEDVHITHINLNDQTIQGFYSKEKKILAVQFHPENSPGPQDAEFLFQQFISYL